MSRKPRIEFPGAFYHVISRGNNRQVVFCDSSDYREFVNCLRVAKERYPFKLYAYSQIPNHFHLLLETIQDPLSVVMRSLLTRYVRYFNKKYERVGHIFQSRYKAILCQKDTYLLELLRYIHLNPVRAELVKSVEDWKWSSHQEYLGRRDNSILDIRVILEQFSTNISSARKKYFEFINDRIKKSSRKELYPSDTFPYLGNDTFMNEMSGRYGELRRSANIKMRVNFDELLKKVASVIGVDDDEIRGSSKEIKVLLARRIFSYIAVYYAGYKIKDIAKILKRSSSAVTLYLRNIKSQLNTNEKVRKMIDEVRTI